jgi:hypothetical protein
MEHGDSGGATGSKASLAGELEECFVGTRESVDESARDRVRARVVD